MPRTPRCPREAHTQAKQTHTHTHRTRRRRRLSNTRVSVGALGADHTGASALGQRRRPSGGRAPPPRHRRLLLGHPPRKCSHRGAGNLLPCGSDKFQRAAPHLPLIRQETLAALGLGLWSPPLGTHAHEVHFVARTRVAISRDGWIWASPHGGWSQATTNRGQLRQRQRQRQS